MTLTNKQPTASAVKKGSEMMKTARFFRKEVVVEAVQFTTNNEPDNRQMEMIVEWLVSLQVKAWHDGTDIYIRNSDETETRVSVGCWIVNDYCKDVLVLPNRDFSLHYEECTHEWEMIDDTHNEHCLLCGEVRPYEMQYFGDEVL